jgi:hypothetical protein
MGRLVALPLASYPRSYQSVDESDSIELSDNSTTRCLKRTHEHTSAHCLLIIMLGTLCVPPLFLVRSAWLLVVS